MDSLLHSALLHSLGYAITNSFWQMGILWLISMALSEMFKSSSIIKFKVALAAQCTGFISFLLTFIFYFKRGNEVINSANVFHTSFKILRFDSHNFNSFLSSFIVMTETFFPLLSLCYICIFCFQAVKWLKGYQYTKQIKLNGLQKIDADWKTFVQKVMEYLNIKQPVKIYLSSAIKSPLTIGFFKPVILIPLACINHLTIQQTEAIILHELAHIKRADYVLNMLQSVIEVFLFFNPFCRLLGNSINKERENCCDDCVLQFQYKPTMYADALFKIAYLQKHPHFALLASGKNEAHLLYRIKRILSCKQEKIHYLKCAIPLLLLALGTAFILLPQNRSNEKNRQIINEKKVVLTPLANQLNYSNNFNIKTLQKKSAIKNERKTSGSETAVVSNNVQKGPLKIEPNTLENLSSKNKLSTKRIQRNNNDSFSLKKSNLSLKITKLHSQINSKELQSITANENIQSEITNSLSQLNMQEIESSIQNSLNEVNLKKAEIEKAKAEIKKLIEMQNQLTDKVDNAKFKEIKDSLYSNYSLYQNSNFNYNLSLQDANNISYFTGPQYTTSSNNSKIITSIMEDKKYKDGYKKKIMIETTDNFGKKDTCKITIELYQ